MSKYDWPNSPSKILAEMDRCHVPVSFVCAVHTVVREKARVARELSVVFGGATQLSAKGVGIGLHMHD